MEKDLNALQAQVDEWIKTVGVRYFSELTNMAMLTEEVGEVARIIARRYGEQSEKESDKAKDLGDEMADVLFVLICLANQTGINLPEAFEKNMAKKTLFLQVTLLCRKAERASLRVDLRILRIRFNERSTRWNLVAHKHRKYLVTRRSVVNGNLT
jgi:NTP pyrophosphatase (non-canonical NTP hydrolase)